MAMPARVECWLLKHYLEYNIKQFIADLKSRQVTIYHFYGTRDMLNNAVW